MTSSFNSQYDLEFSSPYIVRPVVLVLGAISAGYLRRCWMRGELIPLFIVLLIVTVIAIPIYANAGAAVGGLFIALAGLAMLDLRTAMKSKQLSWGRNRISAAKYRVIRQVIFLAFIVCVGVLLAIGSQAAIALILPLSVIIAFGVWKQAGPPQWAPVALGFFLFVMAGLAVILLGNRETWPSWLSASESLSSARHTLWSDALSLWATEPVLGSGPGAFTPSSELASSTPDLAAVHSLILQVGAELGAVGVVLLAAQFFGGLLFAARGSRPVALIAMTAWTALAIHANIDHLEDFPIVGFMGGVLLGWSGLDAQSSGGYSRNEDFVGQE